MEFVTIDNTNFRDFWKLSVKENQKYQVADNIKILARAFVYRDFKPVVFGITENGEPIGLLFYRNYQKDDDTKKYLDQMMIDEKYQNKGYGTFALQKLFSILRCEKAKELYLVYIDGHTDVQNFYEELGFVKTENIDAGEIEMALNLMP